MCSSDLQRGESSTHRSASWSEADGVGIDACGGSAAPRCRVPTPRPRGFGHQCTGRSSGLPRQGRTSTTADSCGTAPESHRLPRISARECAQHSPAQGLSYTPSHAVDMKVRCALDRRIRLSMLLSSQSRSKRECDETSWWRSASRVAGRNRRTGEDRKSTRLNSSH